MENEMIDIIVIDKVTKNEKIIQIPKHEYLKFLNEMLDKQIKNEKYEDCRVTKDAIDGYCA